MQSMLVFGLVAVSEVYGFFGVVTTRKRSLLLVQSKEENKDLMYTKEKGSSVEEQFGLQKILSAAVNNNLKEVSEAAKRLIQRARKAENDLKETQGQYSALLIERDDFMAQRDAELDALELATEQTLKAETRLRQVEDEIKAAQRKLEAAQREASDLKSVNLALKENVEYAESQAESALLQYEVIAKEKNETDQILKVTQKAKERALESLNAAQRDNKGLQSILEKRDTEYRKQTADLKRQKDEWKSIALETRKQTKSQLLDISNFATWIFSTANVNENIVRQQAEALRLTAKNDLQESENLRLRAEQEARTRTAKAMQAVAERQQVENDLVIVRKALEDLERAEIKAKSEIASLEAELDSTPSLARRLSSKIWTKTKKVPSSLWSRVRKLRHSLRRTSS